jgi:hypothetical protein
VPTVFGVKLNWKLFFQKHNHTYFSLSYGNSGKKQDSINGPIFKSDTKYIIKWFQIFFICRLLAIHNTRGEIVWKSFYPSSFLWSECFWHASRLEMNHYLIHFICTLFFIRVIFIPRNGIPVITSCIRKWYFYTLANCFGRWFFPFIFLLT